GTAIGGAVGLPGMNVAEVAAFAQNLPANLLAHSFITRLESIQPALVGLASLFGVIDYTPVPAVPRDPIHPASVRRRLQLQNLGTMLRSPKDLLLSQFDWGAGGFDGTKLIPTLANTLTLLGLYARVGDLGPPDTLSTGLLTIGARSSPAPPGLDLQLHYD